MFFNTKDVCMDVPYIEKDAIQLKKFITYYFLYSKKYYAKPWNWLKKFTKNDLKKKLNFGTLNWDCVRIGYS